MGKKETLFYFPKEVAEIFGISLSAVYEMTRSGQIPSISLEGPKGTRSFVRIPKKWVDEKLKEAR